jgi:hypothetical protein
MSAMSAMSVENALQNPLSHHMLDAVPTHLVTHLDAQMSGTSEACMQSLNPSELAEELVGQVATHATHCTHLAGVEDLHQPRTLLCGCVALGRALLSLCDECNEDRIFTRELRRISRKEPWRMTREERIRMYTAKAEAGQPLFPQSQKPSKASRMSTPVPETERATA